MATDQYNCESIMIAQLALQADLMALDALGGIVHQDNSTAVAATTLDRIVVEAMPRTVYAWGYNQATPREFSCLVKVTVILAQNNPTLLDTYVAAIHAANTGATPGSITTLATSLFGALPSGRGFRWQNTDEGDRTAEENERTASCSWLAVFGA